MSKILTTIIQYSVHRDTESPIYGVGATHITLSDDAAGGYLTLSQSRDDQSQEIKLDFEEIKPVFVACNKLKKACEK